MPFVSAAYREAVKTTSLAHVEIRHVKVVFADWFMDCKIVRSTLIEFRERVSTPRHRWIARQSFLDLQQADGEMPEGRDRLGKDGMGIVGCGNPECCAERRAIE